MPTKIEHYQSLKINKCHIVLSTCARSALSEIWIEIIMQITMIYGFKTGIHSELNDHNLWRIHISMFNFSAGCHTIDLRVAQPIQILWSSVSEMESFGFLMGYWCKHPSLSRGTEKHGRDPKNGSWMEWKLDYRCTPRATWDKQSKFIIFTNDVKHQIKDWQYRYS